MWSKFRTAAQERPISIPPSPPLPCLIRTLGRVETGQSHTGESRYSQEQVVLKGDVCEGPVHQDHLCVLNVFP